MFNSYFYVHISSKGIASEVSKVKEQSVRLTQQISEGQQMQRAVFVENKKLHEEIKISSEKMKELEQRSLSHIFQ